MPRPPQTFVQRWLRAVYGSKLTAAEHDTMAAYAAHMTRAGIIRVPQIEIVAATGRDRRDVVRHVAAAQRIGLLVLVERPARGRVAAYHAVLPGTHRGGVTPSR